VAPGRVPARPLEKERRMRTRPRSVLASAIVLLLGLGLSGSGGPAAQDPGTREGEPGGERQGAEAQEGRKGREGRPLLPGSTRPPTNLKKVGDHWTPYDPPDPESFPPEATLHIIVPGDTLWDLADLAFGNPYLWPQIWNENRYILDSHWIYPGDPLLLPARPAVVTEIVPQGPEGAPRPDDLPPLAEQEEPEAGEEPPAAERPPDSSAIARQEAMPDTPHAPRTVPKLDRLADDVDIRCSGFIARRDTKPDYFIANQEDEAKVGLTEGDLVYLNRGRENGHVEPGTEYSIIVREGEVRHPITHNFVGHYYKRLGTVKLLAAQDHTAIAAISMACDEIRTGYDLVPLLVTSLAATSPPPFNRAEPLDPDKPSGYIVRNADNMRRVGTGYLVDIDLGFEDGVKPGDFLKIYLPTHHYDKYRKLDYDYEWDNRRFQSPRERRDRSLDFPARIIGQLVVLAAEKHTATAKIIYALREIEVGTPVERY
jgi:hypothetical protein